jgi:hypothetical protein
MGPEQEIRMAREGTFTIKYEIEDGYAGGARPQSFLVDEDSIEPDMTEQQIESLLYEMAQEDMLQKVSASVDNVDAFLDWAKGVAAKKSA